VAGAVVEPAGWSLVIGPSIRDPLTEGRDRLSIMCL
jgi:hypothetical protein